MRSKKRATEGDLNRHRNKIQGGDPTHSCRGEGAGAGGEGSLVSLSSGWVAPATVPEFCQPREQNEFLGKKKQLPLQCWDVRRGTGKWGFQKHSKGGHETKKGKERKRSATGK